jgi:hypothetical protein
LEEYSRFVIKELVNHVSTSHVLIAQWDGYVLNPDAWKDEWLDYDYIGAVWHDGAVGNGGFSLRSKRLLEALKDERFSAPFFPEDEKICRDWGPVLEKDYGIKIAPPEIAADFSIEGGRYTNQFGFHSFYTKLPQSKYRPLVFQHCGDHGDIIYSLASVKALGGGVFYISPHVNYDLRQPPTKENARNILPLLNCQKYIWPAAFTDANLSHTDYDLNEFRKTIMGHPNSGSIFEHHLNSAGTHWPEDKPWLDVDFKVQIPDRPIIISRSVRYHNPNFPWQELVKEHGRKMIFVGIQSEHDEFVGLFGFIPRIETPTLLDAARIIAGARVFIGNQSCPMAIAIGLGVNVIQEVWEPDANCLFRRDNFLAIRGERVFIPKQWL